MPRFNAKYKKFVKKENIFKFLLGLNKNLDEVRGRIMAIKPLPPIQYVFSAVIKEESRKKVILGSQNQSLPILN